MSPAFQKFHEEINSETQHTKGLNPWKYKTEEEKEEEEYDDDDNWC